MKVLFVYTDIGADVGYSAGVGILSAILKKEGHETKLIHVSDDLDYPFDLEKIKKDVVSYNPDIICFSITTNQWHFSRQIGISIKKETDIPIVVGGHHPTSAYDSVITEPWVDILCRGEGEIPLTEILERLKRGEDLAGIPNIVYRKEGRVIKTIED